MEERRIRQRRTISVGPPDWWELRVKGFDRRNPWRAMARDEAVFIRKLGARILEIWNEDTLRGTDLGDAINEGKVVLARFTELEASDASR